MTGLANPAIRLVRRRRSVVAGLAFAAMALPAAAGAGPYQVPSSFQSENASNGTSNTQQLPSNFKSENASNSSGQSSSALSSTYTLPSTFRSEATDGHIQLPAPPVATVQVQEPNGFDWGDAGIGAATIAGLLALGGGMTLLVLHHRHRSPGTPAAVVR